jgi:hypothetical protein
MNLLVLTMALVLGSAPELPQAPRRAPATASQGLRPARRSVDLRREVQEHIRRTREEMRRLLRERARIELL